MKPLWKQLFDAVEKSAAPTLEQMTASAGFGEVVRTGLKITRDLSEQSEALSRRWLHLWNLPAAGDITRLHNQIGSLEAELRTLRRHLDEARATATGEPAPAATEKKLAAVK